MSYGDTKMFRVSYLMERIPCKCSNCMSMDTAVDNQCYATGEGIEIPNPEAEMDYCPDFDPGLASKSP
jgi:hypothetical protein